METLGVKSDLMTRMSNVYWILPYYDYAYRSVKVLRCLNQDTRYIWTNYQDNIIDVLNKQTIHIDRYEAIDKNTALALKKFDRYMLFKLDIDVGDIL